MHFYSCFNLGMKRFQYGEISASQLRADFSDDVFEHRTKGQVMRYIIMFATGHRM